MPGTVATFVCYTPYHLMLAEAIVHQARPATSLLILADESGLTQRYPDLLHDAPFAEVLNLLPLRDAAGLRKGDVYRRNATLLRRSVSGRDLGELHIFNPQRPESRVLVSFTPREPVFVEDGLEAYRETRRPSRTLQVLRSLSSLAVGLRPTGSKDYIEYLRWRHGYALVPELVRFGGAEPFPVARISAPSLQRALDRWVLPLGVDAGVRKRGLVLLEHPDWRKEDVRSVLSTVQSQYGLDPRTVLLKAHPRDESVEDAWLDYGAEVAERSLPAEALFGRLEPGGYLLGGNSTTLLTGAIMRPDLRIIYTGRSATSPIPELLARLRS